MSFDRPRAVPSGMELADRLAHLVRGGIPSGLGRGAASARARVRQYAPVLRRRRAAVGAVAFCLVMLCVGFTVGMSGSATAKAHAARRPPRCAPRPGWPTIPATPPCSSWVPRRRWRWRRPPATPTAAPATLTDQPPLAAREDFAFAPYWTLAQSPTFDITGLSTLAYFSIDVNGNGTLDESGPGWNGFQSQDLSDLISRAHAGGRARRADRDRLQPELAQRADVVAHRPGHLVGHAHPAAAVQVARRRELRLRGRGQRRPEPA